MDLSSFGKLPREIRDIVYEYALQEKEPIAIRIMIPVPRLIEEQRGQNILALAKTCKQIRYECTTIFYAINRFILIARPLGRLSLIDVWQKGVSAWLDRLGERNKNRLSHVEIFVRSARTQDVQSSIETTWRSISAIADLFNRNTTQVTMRTRVQHVRPAFQDSFLITVPLNGAAAAEKAVHQAIDRQRRCLELSRAAGADPRILSYKVVELETCRQELLNFVSLIDTTNFGPAR